MSTQPEALRLAEWLETSPNTRDKKAAAELRRLHEVNQELVGALEMLVQSGWSKAFTRYEYDSDEPEENRQRDLVMSLIAKARRTE